MEQFDALPLTDILVVLGGEYSQSDNTAKWTKTMAFLTELTDNLKVNNSDRARGVRVGVDPHVSDPARDDDPYPPDFSESSLKAHVGNKGPSQDINAVVGIGISFKDSNESTNKIAVLIVDDYGSLMNATRIVQRKQYKLGITMYIIVPRNSVESQIPGVNYIYGEPSEDTADKITKAILSNRKYYFILFF